MEIQEENSLIIKQFEELNVPIYGTYKEPLFKAKDIGDLLGIKNIRDTISKFDEKCVIKSNVGNTDVGNSSNTWFLTEDGLYEILFVSRKPLAKQFKVWVRDVIKEIRKTGEYKNKKSIENETKSITLIEHFTDKRIVYLGVVKELEDYTILKYGCTKMIKDTLNRHRNTYGPNFYFIYMTECEKHDELERSIQTHSDLTNRHIKEYDGNQRNELIKVDKEYDTNKLINLIETMKNTMNSIPLELLLSKELTKQKQLDNVKFVEETKQKEMDINLELKKMEFQLEMRRLELQVQVHIPKLVVMGAEPKQDVITEYFNSCTVFSANNLDTIKMTELYRKFVEWIKIQHPNTGYPSNREFTPKFKKLNIGTYKNSINNLNGTSGIINRKFKN